MKPRTAIAAALLVSAIGISPALAQMPKAGSAGQMMQDNATQMTQDMMGGMFGQMMGQMMSHMMGEGGMMGYGMMGSASGFQRDKSLTNDDVRRAVDGRLALSGLSRLKVGAVKDEGEDAAKVDVVTQKNELVFRLKVDRATGRAAVVE
jgi:hypothetical protein